MVILLAVQRFHDLPWFPCNLVGLYLAGDGPEKGWLSIRVPLRLTVSALEMCT